MNKDLAEIASKNGLQLIETTVNMTGYPEGLQKAIIGFDLSIEIFQQHDGWDLWYRTGCQMGEAFLRSAEDFGDDYRGYTKEDLEDFYLNEVYPMVSDFEDFDSLCCFFDKMLKIKDEIVDAEDDELVIACCGEYYATIKARTMSYYYDAHSYAIGLIDRNCDID